MSNQAELKFHWETKDNVYFTGSEHFGKDFLIEMFEEQNNIYTYSVYQENNKIFENSEICKNIHDAKLKGEEFLINEMDNMSRKFGYHR